MKYKLGELVTAISGYAFKRKQFSENGDIPVIKIKNIESPKIMVDSNTNRISKSLFEKLIRYHVKQNDILISLTGSHIEQIGSMVGKVGMYDQKEPAILNQRVAKLCVKSTNKLDPTYFYYWILRKEVQRLLASQAAGTANQANISVNDIYELEIELPSLENQIIISNRIKKLDRKIQLNNQINDNLFALSKVIFDHILGNKTIKFSQISTIQNGYAFKSKEYITDKQLMILRTKNINDNHLFSKNDVIYISNNLFSNYKKFLFNTFDTVLVMVGASIGKTGFITSNMMPALQNQNMWRFRPLISGMPGLLVYQYVNYINEHVKGSATGSARSFYRKKVFNDFNVPYIEHKNYAIFIALQKEINRINVENDILRNIKKSLLNYFF